MKTSKNVIIKKHLGLVFAVIVCALFVHFPTECSNNSTYSSAIAQVLDPPAQKIVVMPFFKGKRPEDIEEVLNCPLERLGWNQNALIEDAEKILTRIVQRTVENHFVEKVIPLADVITAYENMFANTHQKTPGFLAKNLGEALGADYIFLGNVWRYRDHNDMALRAPSGASVAFNVFFLKVETGQNVWKGTFDKTQRAVSDNIFTGKDTVKSGLKWLSANDLARLGVKEVFKKFPY